MEHTRWSYRHHVACNQQISSLNCKRNNKESRNKGLFWSDPLPHVTLHLLLQPTCLLVFEFKNYTSLSMSILKCKPGTTWKAKMLFVVLLLLERELILISRTASVRAFWQPLKKKGSNDLLSQVPGRHKKSKIFSCAHSKGKTLEEMVACSRKIYWFKLVFLVVHCSSVPIWFKLAHLVSLKPLW